MDFQSKKVAMKTTLCQVECWPLTYSHGLQKPGEAGLRGLAYFEKKVFFTELSPRPINLIGNNFRERVKLAVNSEKELNCQSI